MSELPRTQFRYEHTLLEKRQTTGPGQTSVLSAVALTLGILSLTPATFVAGIPAIVVAIKALRDHRPGRGMAYGGLVTGVLGTFVLTFAMLLPIIAWQTDLHRIALVKQKMQAFRSALEDYADENDRRYPKEEISWEQEDDEGMVLHFKGRGRLLSAGGRQGEGVDELKLHYRDEDRPLTGIPTNPYTRERYRVGKDLFYLPEYLNEAGLHAVVNRRDTRCPYVGLAAPSGVPGTVVILGWSPPELRGSPTEYAVVGYGRNTTEPMRRGNNFLVLHN
jgi:hypothetical protein